jgi:hypothetical protein
MSNLINMLKEMDWYYEFSDDHRVWSAGSKAEDSIVKELIKLDEATVNTLIMNHVPTDRVSSIRRHIELKKGDNKNA